MLTEFLFFEKIQRRSGHIAEDASVFLCDFPNDVAEVICHRAHQMQYIYIVWEQGSDLGPEEIGEALNEDIVDSWNIPVFAKVAGEGGKETVRRGFAVEPPQHLRFVDGALLFKIVGDAFGKFPPQVTLDEQFAEVGTAAFVSEQVPE